MLARSNRRAGRGIVTSREFWRIWTTVTRVPRGRVATYGLIARLCGLHNGARTVGWALRALPDDLRIGGGRVRSLRGINPQGGGRMPRWGKGDGSARPGAAP